MAVGKGSIKRAAKAVDSTEVAAPAKEVVEAIVEKKPAAKKAPAKKVEEVKEEVNYVGIGTELPSYLL